MRLYFWKSLWLIFFIVTLVETRINGEKDKFEKLRMTPKTMEKVQNLHKNCYYTAIKAIMGKLGKDLYKKLPTQQKRILARCLDRIEDKRDLTTAAKCITVARKRFMVWQKEREEITRSTTRTPQNWRAFLQQFDDFNRFHVDQNGYGISLAPTTVSTKWWKSEDDEILESTTTVGSTTTSTVSSVPESTTVESRKQFSQKYGISFKKKPNPKSSKITYSQKMPFAFADSSVGNIPFKTQTFKNQNSPTAKNPVEIKNSPSVSVQSVPTHTGFRQKSRSSSRYSTDYSIKSKPLKQIKIPVNPKISRLSRFKSLSYRIPQFYPQYYQSRSVSYFPYYRRRTTSRRFEKLRRRTKRHLRFPDSKQHYYKEHFFNIKSQKYLQTIKKKEDNYGGNIINMIHSFVEPSLAKNKTQKSESWSEIYGRLARVRKASEEQKRVPGAKVYEHRMYDIVLDRDQPTLSPSERRSPAGIVHQAMNFLSNITTHNSIKDAHQVPGNRVLSPRFMPLMPADDGKKVQRTLSPDILAFYNDPYENETLGVNKVGNVPSILKTLGIKEKDRNKVMQMVMDITGSSSTIDEALKIYEYLGMFDKDVSGPILDATERMMDSFRKLEENLQLPQKLGYKKKGFTFIKKKQMQKLLRDQGIKDDEVDLADFDIYDGMTDEQMEESLWMTIENIANNITTLRPSEHKNSTRSKRELIFVLQPTILAPFMFTVQTGASILGPIILSPLLFAPPILNPSVLSPWVLSPGIADPLILAPYVFGPFILGPLVLTPFILTPYALSPNILNPYVITSLILSPIALSPDILSPMVISASVLSPTVLSPAVLTPTYLTGSVLSPSFLS